MAVIIKVKRDFGSALADCRVLFRHCLTPRAQHSEAGVEASFLQMFKAWESFLEDCTLSFMTGRLRCDGRSVQCEIRTGSEETARTLIYQDRPFVEWTDVEKIIERWDRLFPAPSQLVDAIRPVKPELKQMAILRNGIAHSSVSATRKFNELVRNEFGGKPRITRPAQFLVSAYLKDPARTYFDRYADILETTCNAMAG